jgi:hypothetical protein
VKGDLPPTIQTVSSQFTLDNFFSGSPLTNETLVLDPPDKKHVRTQSSAVIEHHYDPDEPIYP